MFTHKIDFNDLVKVDTNKYIFSLRMGEHLNFSYVVNKTQKLPKFIKKDNWKSWDPEIFLGEELHGKVFGIIGFGKIGQAVAQRAAGFGMKVIYYNRSFKDVSSLLLPPYNNFIRHCSLDEVLENSDYISIHLPYNDETNNFVNKDLIGKMKKKPIILNMARGEVLNTKDLIKALELNKIRGAGLDVISSEPISSSHPLCHFENCIVVPHIGTATIECRNEMARIAAKNIYDHYI